MVVDEPLAAEVARLRADNARLRRLLELTPEQDRPAAAAQTGLFLDRPGPVTAGSSGLDKVQFFRTLFVARTDVYATRWENARTFRLGAGGCGWLAKGDARRVVLPQGRPRSRGARNAGGVPVRHRAHVWVFFTGPVAAETARTLGSGLIREAIALRGRMDLAGYDRLFPAQDVLPVGGVGNLIAAPLQGRSRRDGATVFLDLGTLEPQEDQWAYLSSLRRLSPREVERLAARMGPVRVGTAVAGLQQQTSSRTRPSPPATVQVRLGAGVSVDMRELTPAMLATLKHAASMSNPAFYDRQRRRYSTWGVPRFLHSFDETLDGRLVLPCGLADVVATVVTECRQQP